MTRYHSLGVAAVCNNTTVFFQVEAIIFVHRVAKDSIKKNHFDDFGGCSVAYYCNCFGFLGFGDSSSGV